VVGATEQGRSRRPLFARRHVAVDEPLGVVGKIVVGVECPVEHLAGDVLGHVTGPALGRVESDRPKRVRILPAQEIADDGFAIGLGGVGLVVGDAELAVAYFAFLARFSISCSKER
jgi:hypothetical protein